VTPWPGGPPRWPGEPPPWPAEPPPWPGGRLEGDETDRVGTARRPARAWFAGGSGGGEPAHDPGSVPRHDRLDDRGMGAQRGTDHVRARLPQPGVEHPGCQQPGGDRDPTRARRPQVGDERLDAWRGGRREPDLDRPPERPGELSTRLVDLGQGGRVRGPRRGRAPRCRRSGARPRRAGRARRGPAAGPGPGRASPRSARDPPRPSPAGRASPCARGSRRPGTPAARRPRRGPRRRPPPRGDARRRRRSAPRSRAQHGLRRRSRAPRRPPRPNGCRGPPEPAA